MKKILVLSGKGGTGKTTISSALIKLYKINAFADCDVDAPNLHLLFNDFTDYEESNYFGLKKAVINQEKCILCGLCLEKCRFDAIKYDKRYSILLHDCEGCGVCEYVCPAQAISMNQYVNGYLRLYKNEVVFSTATLKMGSGTTGMLVTKVKKQLFDNVSEKEIACIIDGSPGIGCPVIASLSGVDYALLVTEPSISGISDLKRIVKVSKSFNTKIMVCINRYDENEEITKRIKDYCNEENIFVVGEIPFDSKVIEYLNMGKSFIDFDGKASIATKNMFEIIIKNVGI